MGDCDYSDAGSFTEDEQQHRHTKAKDRTNYEQASTVRQSCGWTPQTVVTPQPDHWQPATSDPYEIYSLECLQCRRKIVPECTRSEERREALQLQIYQKMG